MCDTKTLYTTQSVNWKTTPAPQNDSWAPLPISLMNETVADVNSTDYDTYLEIDSFASLDE
jgi:hypothetical protein